MGKPLTPNQARDSRETLRVCKKLSYLPYPPNWHNNPLSENIYLLRQVTIRILDLKKNLKRGSYTHSSTKEARLK